MLSPILQLSFTKKYWITLEPTLVRSWVCVDHLTEFFTVSKKAKKIRFHAVKKSVPGYTVKVTFPNWATYGAGTVNNSPVSFFDIAVRFIRTAAREGKKHFWLEIVE